VIRCARPRHEGSELLLALPTTALFENSVMVAQAVTP
jgi:hypothetical protein